MFQLPGLFSRSDCLHHGGRCSDGAVKTLHIKTQQRVRSLAKEDKQITPKSFNKLPHLSSFVEAHFESKDNSKSRMIEGIKHKMAAAAAAMTQ